MSQIHLTEEQFIEVKALQDGGMPSAKIAQKLGVRLPAVNVAMKCDGFDAYESQWQDNLRGFSDEPPDETIGKASDAGHEIVAPAQSGYYRGLVAKKIEENSNLKEQRAWLLEQVYYLRKAVRFLESRKAVLETAISSMEKQINGGIEIIEQLEDNGKFTEVSDYVQRKNR
jgi:hypothetical protein